MVHIKYKMRIIVLNQVLVTIIIHYRLSNYHRTPCYLDTHYTYNITVGLPLINVHASGVWIHLLLLGV